MSRAEGKARWWADKSRSLPLEAAGGAIDCAACGPRQRSERKLARSSSVNAAGCSHAAKWPPFSSLS